MRLRRLVVAVFLLSLLVASFTSLVFIGDVQADPDVDYCLSFDGNDYVEVADDASLNVSTGDFTFSFWFKTTSAASTQYIVTKLDSADWNAYLCSDMFSGKVEAYIGNATDWADVASSSTYNDGLWHNMVYLRDSGSLKLYIDNSLVDSDDAAGIDGDSSQPLIIGSICFDWNFNYTGYFDEFCIYERAINTTELAYGYNNKNLVLNNSGLVLWHDYDERTGSNANDKSGTGNDGSITGCSWEYSSYLNEIAQDLPVDNANMTQYTVDFYYTVTWDDNPKNTCLRIFDRYDALFTTIWNTTALQNGASVNYGSYTFSEEVYEYSWDCIYYNDEDTSFQSSGNYTLNVDVPPTYRNIGQNVTVVDQDGTIKLYAEGYDFTGLDWAWLATNETGTWKNHTQQDEIMEFVEWIKYVDGENVLGTYDGITFDGEGFLYGCDGYDIDKWNMTSETQVATVNPDDGSYVDSGDLTYYDGKIYISMTDSYSPPTGNCRIYVFYASNLSAASPEYYDIGAHIPSHLYPAGVAYYDNSFWEVVMDKDGATAANAIVQKYDTDFNYQTNYTLAYPYAQGICWHDECCFITAQEGGGVVRYENWLETARQLLEYNWGGCDFEPVTDYFWTPAYPDPISNGSLKHFYNSSGRCFCCSPIDMLDVADTWTLTEFAWSNSSTPLGKVVHAKICYNDTIGNENATSTLTFRIVLDIDGTDLYMWNATDSTISSVSYGSNQLQFSLDATGTSVTKVYCDDKGKPNKLYIAGSQYKEGHQWHYNTLTKTTTIEVIHSSNETIILDWTSPPSAQAPTNSFNLYFQNGKTLAFQYLPSQYGLSKQRTFNITVTSGTLNGTNGHLSLEWPTAGGTLTFRSRDSATLSAPDARIVVNGASFSESASIATGDKVKIIWSGPIIEPLYPIIFAIGMIGLVAMFIGPLYGLNEMKKRRYRDGFVYGLSITVIGLALFIAWLWG